MKQSPFSTLASGASSFETNVNENLERRSPFAQSEFIYGVTTGNSFEIPYTYLAPTPDDTIYAIVINSEADLRIWKDPTIAQIEGVLKLKGSTTTTADFLLFIPRP